jgi:hypothetical protein
MVLYQLLTSNQLSIPRFGSQIDCYQCLLVTCKQDLMIALVWTWDLVKVWAKFGSKVDRQSPVFE